MQDLSQPDITNEDVKDRETQIARICRMEEILDKSGKAVRDYGIYRRRWIVTFLLKKRYANWNCIIQADNGKKILPTMRQASFPGI